MAYKEVGGRNVQSFWAPKKRGESIEGVYDHSFTSQYGLCVVLKKENGENWGLPSHAALQSGLAQTKAGDKIRVSFEGQAVAKDGKTKYYAYKVERDE